MTESRGVATETRSRDGWVKRTAKRVLSSPGAARRAMSFSNFNSRAANKLLASMQRVEGFVADNAALPMGTAGTLDDNERRLLLRYYRFLGDHVPTLPLQPRISILLPVYRPDLEHLREALESVALQVYPNWELCITDDASRIPAVTAMLDAFAKRFPERVTIVVNQENQHISGASNRCLEVATGDYVALLDQDDRLYPNSLSEVVRTVNRVASEQGAPPEIMYSDERVVGPEGQHIADTFHKPGWSPFLHLGVNYTTHLAVYRRRLLTEIGGFRLGLEGAQDHDLMLRASEAATTPVTAIPLTLYQWRSHPASTAGDDDPKPYAWDSGLRTVSEACARRGRPAQVSVDPLTNHYRLAFRLPQPRPRVSVVIPNRDAPELIRSCVTSIRERSTYPDLEIVIVDNGSADQRTLDLYAHFADTDHLFRVVRDPGYFNFARLNNTGVASAQGEYVILLNNDTEVLTADWIEQMLMLAQFEEVGAVGTKLLYPDGSVQHGGVVGIASRIADHVGWFTGPDDHLYIDMVDTVHESLAVTAACLMVRRSLYLQIGGLDEVNVPNGYGDVDLCLRLREQGLTNVYTPYAALTHHESATRSRNVEVWELQYMRRRWPDELLNDPYLNPNLNLSGQYSPDRTITQPDISARLFREWLRTGQLS